MEDEPDIIVISDPVEPQPELPGLLASALRRYEQELDGDFLETD